MASIKQISVKELASDILSTATKLSDGLARLNLAEPSFESGLPDMSNEDIANARQKLLQSLDELKALLTDPSLLLFECVPTLVSIMRLGVLSAFPPEGATVQELAAKVDGDADLIRRLMAHAATFHVFHQTAPGHFVHTASSKVLVENEYVQARLRSRAAEAVPATTKIGEAAVRFPKSQEPEECGWSVANNISKPFFPGLSDFPSRSKDFHKSMSNMMKYPGLSAEHLAKHFPRSSGNEDFTVVDVGGGTGHISLALAKHDPNAKFIVQDTPELVEQGERDLPDEFRNQITLQVHDFLTPQPVKDADVYLLRQILHDWPDKYAQKILRNLIPALKPGVKVILCDRVLGDLGSAHYLVERDNRSSDLLMLALFNSKERNLEDWTELINGADSRFSITQVNQPPGSKLSVIELTWEGKS